MFKRKLISVRIDEDVLSKIDAWAAHARWYKRSDVINWLLRKSADAVLKVDGDTCNTYLNLSDVKLTAKYKDQEV